MAKLSPMEKYATKRNAKPAGGGVTKAALEKPKSISPMSAKKMNKPEKTKKLSNRGGTTKGKSRKKSPMTMAQAMGKKP